MSHSSKAGAALAAAMLVVLSMGALSCCQSGDCAFARAIWAITGASPKTPLPPNSDTYEVLGYREGLNLYVVRASDQMYRGGRMTRESGADALDDLGVKTVIAVEAPKVERQAPEEHDWRLVMVPFEEDGLTPAVLASFLEAVDANPPPYYIHCCGCDGGPRSAALLAHYRIQREGWSYDDAALEFARLSGAMEGHRPMLNAIHTRATAAQASGE